MYKKMLLVSAILFSTCLGFAQEKVEAENDKADTGVVSDYYWSGGKKIFIKKSYNQAVFFYAEESVDKNTLEAYEGLPAIKNIFIDKKKSFAKIQFEQNESITNTNQLLEQLQGVEPYDISGVSFGYKYEDGSFVIPSDEIIFRLNEGYAINQVLALTDNIDGDIAISPPNEYGYYRISVSDMNNLLNTANTIYESGFVEWSHPNFFANIHKNQDPNYVDQYHLNNTGQTGGASNVDINAPEAWATTLGGNLRVAVIDDGVEAHEDMETPGGVSRILAGFTPVDAAGNGAPLDNTVDEEVGHGQACAGLIGASHNDLGVRGVAPNALIVPVNIFAGGETDADIADAINWAWDEGEADIISNSWSYDGKNTWIDVVEDAIDNATDNGRGGLGSVVVFSAGNNSKKYVDFPSNVDNVLTVGAVDEDGEREDYSPRSDDIDVVAPSGDTNGNGDVWTTDRLGAEGYDNGNYNGTFGGTSAAAPQAAGVAVLVISLHPTYTQTQVRNLIMNTAGDLGDLGKDKHFGHGIINALGVINGQSCDVFGNEEDNYHRSYKRYKAYRFVSGEMFLATGKVLLKFNNNGGSGQNMFAIQQSGSSVTSVPGYNYWIGTQVFNSAITDVDYIDGYTLVSTADGRIVKINGTGGSGQNMFAINQHTSGYTGVSGYSYYVGSHKFNSAILDVTHINGKTLLSFANNKMLKVNGSGGSGFNLFAITEDSNHFYGISGYSYYVGEQKFNAAVTKVAPIGSKTFICFNDGRIMKVHGSGGSGERMFNVVQTSYGFATYSNSYTVYLVGSQKLSAAVSDVNYILSKTLFAFNNGKVLKLNGTGGSGQNMFNITETTSGFNTYSNAYTVYLSGHQKFNARVVDMDYIDGNTILSFYDGRMLKVTGNGGTGAVMFNVSTTGNGFQIHSGAYTNYLVGSTNFNASVASVTSIDGYMFIALANGKWIKINGNGGSGYNMFALAKHGDAFKPICGYNYFKGFQDFTAGFYNRMASSESDENNSIDHESSMAIKMYPNPTDGMLTLEYPSGVSTRVEILNIVGKTIQLYTKQDGGKLNIDMNNYAKGVYMVRVSQGSSVRLEKLIVQ